MTFKRQIPAKVFRAIETVNIDSLSKCTDQEIRPILPCLVRMSLIRPVDTSNRWLKQKQDILAILTGIELVNSIVALLSIDFHALEADVKKEQQLRQKVGSTQTDSVLIGSLVTGLALEYERSDMTRRLRLVLSEILFIQSQILENEAATANGESEFYIKSSELFDNDIYAEEISDVICIALAELPTLLNVITIAETLLHVHNGPVIICRIVANFPDAFSEVCSRLIARGERQEEALSSSVRGAVISMLCRMNPWQALSVRSKCVELCRMPALAVSLSLDHRTSGDSDLLPFITGLLLGNDVNIRNWFALFIRTGQKRKGEVSSTALQQLRDELMRRLQVILSASTDSCLNDDVVVQASSLLRLYCALRGIGSIKFQDEEIYLLVQLITLHPNPSPAGVRFVSIGLCMLIACSSLIAIQEHERKCIEWVQWLVREEAYFESASGVAASFGEMLLLMAIHFHSNQLSAICELVCATLGMKMTIRHNNMTRMKQVFTQEIFTEQVVTAHAVKVPVTPNLNATMSGFLPIHCIHQLLKSRLFSKHNVNIKHWIYRQICVSVSPLHAVLPLLVDAYVHSVLLGTRTGECANKPLLETEIRKVFQYSAVGRYTNFDVQNSPSEPTTTLSTAKTNTTNLTPQLLMLYYLLLYEDVRLNAAAALMSNHRRVKLYSAEFLSELPIKYLLTHAQKDQSSYSTLFGPLLKLLATHFPHLTLTEDWLDDIASSSSSSNTSASQVKVTEAELQACFEAVDKRAATLAKMLQVLRNVEQPIDIWRYAEVVTRHARTMLAARLPRYLQDLYRDVWLRLNTVLPRRLWVLTVRSLVGGEVNMTSGSVVAVGTKVDVADDPLQVMRCDERVFRCAPLYAIVLRVLRASLASSRSQLLQHLQSHPRLDVNGMTVPEPERDDMCRALIAAQVRFERTKTRSTNVIFMTEGLLLRQVQDGDVIDSYDVIILDEVHERHLHCDFLVGIMKCLLQKPEPKFKLILMSATINLELFSNYFRQENCHVIQVPGRLYPIEIVYNDRIKDPYDKKSRNFDCGPYINILERIDAKFTPQDRGDVLIFLNGYSEISALLDAVTAYSQATDPPQWLPLPLHGSLSLVEQDRVFDYAPNGSRKCIISTNIAETSVTIDGVRFVVDSGRVNRMSYENNTTINRLKECAISKDSAKQRAGRAGRTGPGYCYRLYSEEEFGNFEDFTPAEIKLVPLESLVLQMVSLGLSDINSYPFLEKPEEKSLLASLERLKYCGALKPGKHSLELTTLGENLSKIPVNITIGKLLLVSSVFGQLTAVFPIAALLSVQTPITQRSHRDNKALEARKALDSNHGDILSLLNYYREWLELKSARDNTKKWATRHGLEEQRFYEVTKLVEQFRGILDDAKVLVKERVEGLTGAERSMRHGELKQLRDERRKLKEVGKVGRKVLSHKDVEDEEEEEVDGRGRKRKGDLRDVEFRIVNDGERMKGLLNDVRATSHKQLTILKESAAIQMLLETCIETDEDRTTPGHQWALQEVRSMVCCYIHQVFIADTGLAKLVHFQGYPSELIEVTVKGVPSMHICLDFLKELMQQPSMKKQVFAIQLLSHLSTQYALPKSLGLCAMALNILFALLTSVSSSQRIQLFRPTLPALVRIADAFPPLTDDICQLLTQLAKVSLTQATLDSHLDAQLSKSDARTAAQARQLCDEAHTCFEQILAEALLKNNTYAVTDNV